MLRAPTQLRRNMSAGGAVHRCTPALSPKGAIAHLARGAAPEARKPRVPEARKPRVPKARKPRAPKARKPRAPETRKPRVPEARKPRVPKARKPRVPKARNGNRNSLSPFSQLKASRISSTIQPVRCLTKSPGGFSACERVESTTWRRNPISMPFVWAKARGFSGLFLLL